MNKTMARVCLFGLVFSSISAAHAASYSAIPVSTPGFSISLTGLYLQPNANNLTYAVYTHPLPVPAPNWSQVTVKPGYSAAFNLGVQYRFADVSNAVSINWLNLNTNDSDSFRYGGQNTSVAPPYYFGPLAQALLGTSANSTVKFNVNDAGVTFSHLINLGDHLQLDPFAGLAGAYLRQEITSTYLGVDSLGAAYSITTNNTSKFTGIGPRLGLNATYYVANGFGITARLAAAVFAGSVNSTTNFNSFGTGNHVLTPTKLANQDQNNIVPAIDSKLEINYLLPVNNTGSNVTFAAGYMFASYINAINQVEPTSLVPGAFNNGTVAIETSAQTQNNLNLNGPYVTITWKI